MKGFYLCLIAVSMVGSITAVSKDEIMQLLENFGQNCDPVPSKEDYEAILSHKGDPEKSTKCFKLCLMEQFELITPDNKVSKEKIQPLIGMVFEGKEEEAAEIIDTCNPKMIETDKCEAAHAFAVCAFDEIKRREWPIPDME